MKKLLFSAGIAATVLIVSSVIVNALEVKTVTDKLIRLHIVADSDEPSAQELKLKLRDEILDYMSVILGNCKSKAEAEKAVEANIGNISAISRCFLKENGCDLPISVSYEKTLVDKRVYDDFTLPEGIYDALCIKIGSGQGKNWWCVLYPSLCMSSAVSIDDCECFDSGEIRIMKEPEKVKYKLFCFEFAEKLWTKIKKRPALIQ